MDFSKFPKLKTERLNLTKLIKSDSEEIYFLRSNAEVCKYLDHPKAKSISDAEEFIEKIDNVIKNNVSILWAIRIIGSTEMVGTICLWNFSEDELSADIGFVLHPVQQRKGIMSEAVKKVLEYGFSDLSLNTIYGEVDPMNIPSIKLMEKYGFKLDTKNEDTVIYKLTRTSNNN